MVKLQELVKGLPLSLYSGDLDIEITGLCSHSKYAAPGNLFIARKGGIFDGNRYLEEALAAGVIAIMTECAHPNLQGITQLISFDPQQIEGHLADRFYGSPSRSLYVVGITGTNGKTTTAYLLKYLFDRLHFPSGLIGTIEYITGESRFLAERTTPEAILCQKLLWQMVQQGCNSVCMEIASHGIQQRRCEGIVFQAAIFTNLSQDHLDYHGDMQSYAQVKAKLFQGLGKDKIAIVNGQSPWLPFLVEKCEASLFTYGFSSCYTLYADEIVISSTKTLFTLHYQEEAIPTVCPLIGRYNILNALAAVAACLSRGILLKEIAPLLADFHPVTGRLEKVVNERGVHIFIDYAHTPDALGSVLDCLREIGEGRIITVFGCGGDRDRKKRAQMGKIADEKSDFTIITSDNPRSEDPLTICQEIQKGFTSTRFQVLLDRKEAIAQALGMASSQDIVLIAGKGHETYQTFAHQSLPFDDKQVACEMVEALSTGRKL